jgi:hypothetical protein
MVQRTTKEEGGEGIVLNGAAIRSQVIAESLGLRDRSVRTYLDILCDANYLRRDGSYRKTGGYSYYVQKAKKWWNKAHQSGGQIRPQTPLERWPDSATGAQSGGQILPSGGQIRPHPHTPLKEEQKEQKENPTPEPGLDPSMIARAVLETLSLSGQELLRNLTEVAKAEMRSGNDPEKLLAQMCAAWEEYSKTTLKWHVGAAKFFGDRLWKNKTLWAWMDGKAPQGRVYANGSAK